MELKYYLRGLGLGIIITAIIMGVATSRGRAMTDAEIIARAKQLGMTEDKVLTETVSGEKETGKDGITDDSSGNPPDTDNKQAMDGDVSLGENKERESAEPEDTVPEPDGEGETEAIDPVQQDQDAETAQTGEEGEANTPDGNAGELSASQEVMAASGNSAAVTIGSGDGSYEVSQKLADLGVVSSAAEYDTFLCENGYDKRLRTGTHTIPAGASETQIARIITGME